MCLKEYDIYVFVYYMYSSTLITTVFLFMKSQTCLSKWCAISISLDK